MENIVDAYNIKFGDPALEHLIKNPFENVPYSKINNC